ncbi:MAG: prolyl oligopeptidase family serine peptidase [Elusimicrobiota bacterium]
MTKLIKTLLGVESIDFYHNSQGRQLKAQMWKPVKVGGSKKIPLVAFDVGLQFRIWDISLFPAIIASLGFAVVGTEYRRIEIAKGEVTDIVNLIEFTKKEFNFVLDKVILVGVSMGAATMLKIASKFGKELNVISVVSIGAFADLARAYYYALAFVKDKPKTQMHVNLLNLYIRHIFASPSVIPWEYTERSPSNFVPFIECPVLFIHGRKDKIVPVDHSLELYYKMLYLGKDVTLALVPGEGIHTPLRIFHMLNGLNVFGFLKALWLTAKFLRKSAIQSVNP